MLARTRTFVSLALAARRRPPMRAAGARAARRVGAHHYGSRLETLGSVRWAQLWWARCAAPTRRHPDAPAPLRGPLPVVPLGGWRRRRGLTGGPADVVAPADIKSRHPGDAGEVRSCRRRRLGRATRRRRAWRARRRLCAPRWTRCHHAAAGPSPPWAGVGSGIAQLGLRSGRLPRHGGGSPGGATAAARPSRRRRRLFWRRRAHQRTVGRRCRTVSKDFDAGAVDWRRRGGGGRVDGGRAAAVWRPVAGDPSRLTLDPPS